MSTYTYAGPIGRLDSVGPGIAIFDQRAEELVDQVRVRTAVPRPLNERKMLGVLDRPCEPTDRLGQQVSVIGHRRPW